MSIDHLPDSLSGLRELAYNLYWSWNHQSHWLWEKLHAEVWHRTGNPVQVLQATSEVQLAGLAKDPEFVAKLNQVSHNFGEYLTQESWYSQNYFSPQNSKVPIKNIAYFSMEFGLCEALPLYAGGLGMLAGDYLKTASDLGVPLVAIGLFYQQGYFRQHIDEQGWQQETYLFNDPATLPAQPLLFQQGEEIELRIAFTGRDIFLKVWQVNVGRIPLYLLDTNDSRNLPQDRTITSKLYSGVSELRLMQEIVLGIGGWRLLDTLGLTVDVCHLNEGHAAFATLERIRCHAARNALNFWQALWAMRAGNLFTTHTAVAAGFDRYPTALLRHYISDYAAQLGVSPDDIIELGQPSTGKTDDTFNMAYLAMRTCAYANGVSKLHGEVSRTIFQDLFPRWPARDIPIGQITNGVHVPTWDSRWADDEWTRLFGKPRWRGGLDCCLPAQTEQLSDIQLSRLAALERLDLVNYVRARFDAQLKQSHQVIDSRRSLALDPNILTMGFARRFAEYKRADLLLTQPERFAKILNNPAYPLQIIVAGKAHPNDDQGKRAIQAWHQFIHHYQLQHRVVFIEDYDIALAQQLVRGVDLWINTPRRPWEACGTSGMKILVNGGLNISTLDGWWGEAYTPEVGWAIGGENFFNQCSDEQDAEQLYCLLEEEIAPLFYRHNAEGLALDWLKRVRASMSTLTTQFSTNRMIKDYLDQYYQPAASDIAERVKNQSSLAKNLWQWDRQLRQSWHEIHIDKVQFHANDSSFSVTADIYLGSIDLQAVRVQLIADSWQDQAAITVDLTAADAIENAINSFHWHGEVTTNRPTADFTVRVIPFHAAAKIPAENALVAWQIRNDH